MPKRTTRKQNKQQNDSNEKNKTDIYEQDDEQEQIIELQKNLKQNQKQSSHLKRTLNMWTHEEDKLLNYFYKKLEGKWDKIQHEIPNRNSSQCAQRYRRLNPSRIRSHWTDEEDEIVCKLVKKYGKNWGEIAKNLDDRNGKQVRERYINCLDKTINWDQFTKEEDEKILTFFEKNGTKWSEITKILPGRPENMIKNRYYAYLKKQKDKCEDLQQSFDSFELKFKPQKKLKVNENSDKIQAQKLENNKNTEETNTNKIIKSLGNRSELIQKEDLYKSQLIQPTVIKQNSKKNLNLHVGLKEYQQTDLNSDVKLLNKQTQFPSHQSNFQLKNTNDNMFATPKINSQQNEIQQFFPGDLLKSCEKLISSEHLLQYLQYDQDNFFGLKQSPNINQQLLSVQSQGINNFFSFPKIKNYFPDNLPLPSPSPGFFKTPSSKIKENYKFFQTFKNINNQQSQVEEIQLDLMCNNHSNNLSYSEQNTPLLKSIDLNNLQEDKSCQKQLKIKKNPYEKNNNNLFKF